MTLPTSSERDCEQAKLLLQEYSFDLQGFKAGELVAIWQERLEAEPTWIRAAVLEALYQGRYKAFSVEQILQGWKRRGHPVRHFNSEFERVVFGPIDPTISKYAMMTTQSPSELMLPQSEIRLTEASATTEAIAEAPPAVMTATSADLGTVPAATTDATPDPPHLELPPTAIATSPPPTSEDAPAMPPPDDRDAESTTAMFNQPAPIEKFQPQPEPSEFYQRLQAVARHEE